MTTTETDEQFFAELNKLEEERKALFPNGLPEWHPAKKLQKMIEDDVIKDALSQPRT